MKWALVILCLFATTQIYAQTTYTGCVIYEASGAPRTYTPMYTSATGSTTSCNGYTVQVYNSTPATQVLDSYCSIAPPLANASPALKRDCIVGGACGLVKTLTLYLCPIDGVEIFLLALACVAMVYRMRNNLRFT